MKRAVLDEISKKVGAFSAGTEGNYSHSLAGTLPCSDMAGKVSPAIAAIVSHFLQRDGWETKVHNALFLETCRKPRDSRDEELQFMKDALAAWTKRILRSINAMCTELSLPLARKRSSQQAVLYAAKWDTLGTECGSLKPGLKPVYSPKDFYDVITNIKNPNLCVDRGTSAYWGMIPVEVDVKAINELQQMFKELDPSRYQHLGIDDYVMSEFENEHQALGQRVLRSGSVAAARQYVKFGCPMGLRGKLWSMALGVVFDDFQLSYFDQLRSSVIEYDLLMDCIMMQDIRMTSANDEHFFVFEDVLHQVVLALLRDVHLTDCKQQTTRLKSYIRGHLGSTDFMVTYPPSGVVPFYGFSLYVTPFCYLFKSSPEIYLCFSAFYQNHLHRLHNISSHCESIVSLSRQFEDLLQSENWPLFQHLVSVGVQPLKLVFNWLMQAFAGLLDSFQTFLLWDRIIGFDSLLLLPLLAVGILSFRKESLMQVTSVAQAEAVLSDIGFVQVIPLIQLALFGRVSDG
ncbi:TBC1 domain family member 19-like [Corticium candelabrum]|uniref:TBC1 domain family member 19-like n=1 Tax=Corticium candelabrum TaxID=121492 RepID=UPI002E25E2AA|nr:TBC1 domain family member 19-like [Corticium candelabrum]